MKALAAEQGYSLSDISSPTELVDAVKDQLDGIFQNLDEETAKELFSFAQDKAADGSLDTEAGISETIAEGEEKFGVSIDEEDAKQVVKVMNQLEDLGFDSGKIVEDASKLYDKYGSDFVDHVDEVVKDAVTDAVATAAKSFFASMWEAIKDFFRNLF